MSDFRTRLGDELVRAAAARAVPVAAPPRRHALVPTLAAVLVALAGVALVLALGGGPDPDGHSARERFGLGVLDRPATAADRSAAVRRAEAGLRGTLAIRPGASRLLATDPDGRPYVLVAVESFPEGRGRTLVPASVPDGLCLATETVEGPAARCWSRAAVAAGEARGAVARRAYGLVPDGVAFVAPETGGRRVAVRDNFYVLDRPPRVFGPTRWFDAAGDPVAKTSRAGVRSGPDLQPVPRLDLAVAQAGGGPPLALGDLPRAPALVTFGASWCAPCRAQEPLLREARRHGLTVVLVASQDGPGEAARTDARIGAGVVTLDDRAGRLRDAWRVGGLPATFVVDADRRIVAGQGGRVDRAFLRSALDMVALR